MLVLQKLFLLLQSGLLACKLHRCISCTVGPFSRKIWCISCTQLRCAAKDCAQGHCNPDLCRRFRPSSYHQKTIGGCSAVPPLFQRWMRPTSCIFDVHTCRNKNADKSQRFIRRSNGNLGKILRLAHWKIWHLDQSHHYRQVDVSFVLLCLHKILLCLYILSAFGVSSVSGGVCQCFAKLFLSMKLFTSLQFSCS